MPFLRALHPGTAYGLGHMATAGSEGQFVTLTANNTFSPVTAGNQNAFGVLKRACAAGSMPGVFCNGGVYETDLFAGTPTAGSAMTVNAQGHLTTDGNADDPVVAQAISLTSNLLRFKLLV